MNKQNCETIIGVINSSRFYSLCLSVTLGVMVIVLNFVEIKVTHEEKIIYLLIERSFDKKEINKNYILYLLIKLICMIIVSFVLSLICFRNLFFLLTTNLLDVLNLLIIPNVILLVLYLTIMLEFVFLIIKSNKK